MWKYFVAVLAILLGGCGGLPSTVREQREDVSFSSSADIRDALNKAGLACTGYETVARVVVVGAAALAISVFLPLVQPVSALRMVEDNTLIQNGGWGWVQIGAALGIAGNGYRASRGRLTAQWLLLICCIVAAGIIFVDANNNDLYPVGPNGTVDTSQPGTQAHLGIAVYVAGAGVLAAFIAWLLFLLGEDENGARVAPAPEQNAGVRKPTSPPKSQVKRQRAQVELEAEARAAEAEEMQPKPKCRLLRRGCAQSGYAWTRKPRPNRFENESISLIVWKDNGQRDNWSGMTKAMLCNGMGKALRVNR